MEKAWKGASTPKGPNSWTCPTCGHLIPSRKKTCPICDRLEYHRERIRETEKKVKYSGYAKYYNSNTNGRPDRNDGDQDSNNVPDRV